MLLVIGHSTRQNGKVYEFPNSLLLEELTAQKKTFAYLRHAIDGKYISQLLIFKKGTLYVTIPIPCVLWPAPVRYATEFLLNLLIIAAITCIHQRRIICIAIDPLNAISAILAQKLLICKHVVYYSVDYSKTRFTQPTLNTIYQWIDRTSALKADQVWNVSKRITQLRTTQGVDKKKNKYVPNAIAMQRTVPDKRKRLRNPIKVITLGILNDQLDYSNFLHAMQTLKSEGVFVELTLVGNGPAERAIKELVQQYELESQVRFIGHVEHSEAIRMISNHDIGTALYNGSWSFNYYGDSLKCREFFSCGLPVITTNTHSTVEDIVEHRAGIVCEQNEKSYATALTNIATNYNTYSKNALLLGKRYENTRSKLLAGVLEQL